MSQISMFCADLCLRCADYGSSFFVNLHQGMKLDTSGFESTAPLFGASSELRDGFSNAPSFDLPVTADVSSRSTKLIIFLHNVENIFDDLFVYFCFSLMNFKRKLKLH